jgi:hypothetical protein
MPAKKPNRKRRKPYSAGELNRLVDSFIHPFYREHEGLRLLDGLLHGLIEQNPPASLKKFIHYNLPEIVKKISKKWR